MAQSEPDKVEKEQPQSEAISTGYDKEIPQSEPNKNLPQNENLIKNDKQALQNEQNAIKENKAISENELNEIMLKERAHLFTRREGFSYHYVHIEWRKGIRFGLVIKAYEQYILVCKLDPSSLSSEKLRIGDRLIDVDGKPVTNRTDAKRELVNAIKNNRK
ncbi:unnamed protein product, partial [Anisakis simplex]|uniref:PDZ domain-containing protein n=1 Tax=Anisakis simplex TaxID=6269 RepID=A0A0M3J9Z4_ANISI